MAVRVLLADKLGPQVEEQLKKDGCIVVTDPSLNGTKLRDKMQQFKPNIIVVRSTKINKSHLDASESLTLIVRAGAGFNTIAVDEASNKGWMYSLFTLFMLIVFEMMMVKRRMSNMKMIRNMRTKPFLIYVYRSNRWERMSTTEIVPGDIISLVRSHAGMDDEITNIRHMNEQTIVPCDVLLLTGNCVVDEALLTGESAPQIKEPIDISNPNQLLDLKSLNKISLISGGTKIVASNFDNIEADKSNNNNNIIITPNTISPKISHLPPLPPQPIHHNRFIPPTFPPPFFAPIAPIPPMFPPHPIINQSFNNPNPPPLIQQKK
eukprot:722845_1